MDLFSIAIYYLNTSNVNVNQKYSIDPIDSQKNLNTSNVNVNLTISFPYRTDKSYLNTSNVNVNLNYNWQEQRKVSFKYIQC